jgi:hypothetical protein
MESFIDKFFEIFVIGLFITIIRGWLAEKVKVLFNRFLVKTNRDRAIVSHFISQAKGEGHSSASPVDCGEGKCTVFGSRMAVV